MKKILLGTTGLVAVALLATAASADTPKVTLGGFSDFQAGYTSDDFDGATRGTDFRNDNEITVKVDGKTNGGLGYGAQIDLEADTTDDVNNQGTNAARTFTYLEGGWGRVELGDNKSVAATMRIDASTVAAATGGINGSWTYFVNNQAGIAAGGSTGFITTSKLVTEHGSTVALNDESTYNSTKINYYTPKFVGFQGGVSYTPGLDRGQTVDRVDTTPGDIENIWNLGLGYENTFGAFKFAAAATGEFGDAETAATEDTRAWNLGALLGYQGFSLAASYGDWDDSDAASGLEDNTYWTAGLGYTAGPIGVSATYLSSERSQTATTENEFDNIVLGAEYKLAPGLTPYAEVSFYEFDGAGAIYDNDGTTVILGTQVAF